MPPGMPATRSAGASPAARPAQTGTRSPPTFSAPRNLPASRRAASSDHVDDGSVPAVVSAGTITTAVPALIAAAGERASLRFLEFFAAAIRNPNTRRAYLRALIDFLAWCEQHQI